MLNSFDEERSEVFHKYSYQHVDQKVSYILLYLLLEFWRCSFVEFKSA